MHLPFYFNSITIEAIYVTSLFFAHQNQMKNGDFTYIGKGWWIVSENKYLDSNGLIRLVANIQHALSYKADIDYIGSPVSKEELLSYVRSEMLTSMYPVGSIYISTSSISPANIFGGEWNQIKDVFLLSAGDAYEAGSIGGEASHVLTVDEIPSHSHIYKRHAFDRNDTDPTTGEDVYGANNKTLDAHEGTTSPTGGNMPHNNMPPYLTVYVWKRTA